MGHQTYKHTRSECKVERNSAYANGRQIEFTGCKCEDLYNRPRARLPHYNSPTTIIIIIIMQSRLISSRAGKLAARKSLGERILVYSQRTREDSGKQYQLLPSPQRNSGIGTVMGGRQWVTGIRYYIMTAKSPASQCKGEMAMEVVDT